MKNKTLLTVLLAIVVIVVAVLAWNAVSPSENDNQNSQQNQSDISVSARYDDKIVYETNQDTDVSALRNSCNAEGGVFNTCGNGCAPDAEVCAQVCVYTCDLTSGQNNNNIEVGQSIIDDIESKSDLIEVSTPQPGAEVSSPLTVTGEARGTWYFEATFPVVLTDWDGRIIAEGNAEAEGDWMTEEFVPFTATLDFSDTDISSLYSNRGTLILQKANPSGLPQNDNALEFPVQLVK